MVTHKKIKERFSLLCQIMGKKEGWDKGNWRLNYSTYGGWRIDEVLDDGAIKPLYWKRLSSGAFYDALGLAITMLEIYQKNKEVKDA